MRIQTKKYQGFSLVEVVVAAVIFIIAAMGIFGVFSMSQNLSTVSEKEIIAANYGRQLLEDLRANVDQRTWAAGTWPLTCDSTWRSWPTAPTTWDAFSNLSGNATYNCVENEDGIVGLRKVTLNVSW